MRNMPYLRNSDDSVTVKYPVVGESGVPSGQKTNSFPTERQSVVIQVIQVVYVTTTTVLFTLKEIVNIRDTTAPLTCLNPVI